MHPLTNQHIADRSALLRGRWRKGQPRLAAEAGSERGARDLQSGCFTSLMYSQKLACVQNPLCLIRGAPFLGRRLCCAGRIPFEIQEGRRTEGGREGEREGGRPRERKIWKAGSTAAEPACTIGWDVQIQSRLRKHK